MVRVAPVRLAFNPRTLWFDPRDLDIKKDDPVVVLTARGVEFGYASGDIFEISEEREKKLKSPLKPVKRLATEADVQRAAEMEEKGKAALPIFKEMAAEANSDMHPVSVEYLLEGDKAVFYFEAEERVDFRELVRKLASRFHVRVDMRQIGVRDEARMIGGVGHCGQELCCARLGGEFCPVSIRMAKEQDLSLNPQKISGVCGRLMCCLRYEFDAYKDFKSRAPKQNATVKTPDGPAKVVDLDVPREVVSVRIEGEKPVRVPLSDFDAPAEGSRPNAIGKKAWEKANTPDEPAFSGNSLFSTEQFTGTDKLAEAGSVRRTGSAAKRSRKDSDDKQQGEGRRARRRRSTKVSADGERTSKPEGKDKSSGSQQKRKPRRRGDQKPQGEKQQGRAGQGASKGKSARNQDGGQGQKGAQRPGQKSSGLRNGGKQSQRGASEGQKRPRKQQEAGAPGTQAQPGQNEHRRARRRSHKAGGAASDES